MKNSNLGNYELPTTELIDKRLRNLLHGSYHPSHDYSRFEEDFRSIELHTANKPKVYGLALDLHAEIESRTNYPRFNEIARFLENRIEVLTQYESVKKVM